MLLAVCIIIGCTAEIDVSAASSSSANLAVLLEYCLGLLSLLLVLAIRIVGITFFSLGIIEMINEQYSFVIPPIAFMIIGAIVIFIGYRSKPYEPLVRIGKLKKIPGCSIFPCPLPISGISGWVKLKSLPEMFISKR